MDDFLKMDIFFVVATLAVVIVTALLTLALLKILKILRHVERISDTVSQEAQLIRSDIDDVRANIRAEGFKFKHLAKFVRSSVRRFVGRTTK